MGMLFLCSGSGSAAETLKPEPKAKAAGAAPVIVRKLLREREEKDEVFMWAEISGLVNLDNEERTPAGAF
jgi:hypothetical protein